MSVRVAFLDHHLNNFHADKFLSLLRGPLKGEGLEVVSAWESDPAGEDWCIKNNVPRAESAESAVRAADAVFLLAPDNIEDHLKLALVALPAGKPTLIDKFLAPTVTEAKEIIALSKRHKTPIYSSSSLRYAVELEAVMKEFESAPVTEFVARGMGKWNGYGIHTLSLALRVMGGQVKRLIDTGTRTARTVTLDYGNDRKAALDVRTAHNEYHEFPWTFGGRVGDRYVAGTVKDFDGFYANLMTRSARFVKTRETDMPIHEALAAVAILEGVDRSREAGGKWLALSDLGV